MYNGKYANAPVRKPRRGRKRTGTLILSLLLLLCLTIGGTMALLLDKSSDITNTFIPGEVTCEVQEDFNKDNIDNIKKNVNVKNTGNVNAYIRVKLISYRVNEAGQPIGGDAPIPDFAPGEGWKKHGDHYYYTSPVAPGKTPSVNLIGESGITLENYLYDFYGATVSQEESAADPNAEPYGIKSGKPGGGKQVIEVVAEAIQADGVVVKNGQEIPAVTDAWGIAVVDGKLSFT